MTEQPRRSNASGEVEALAEVMGRTGMMPYDDGTGGWLFRHSTATEQAAAVLASDWLAAYVAARERRAVRDALGPVRALASEWEQAERDGGPRNYAGSLFGTAARCLRAALPDDLEENNS